MKTRFVFSYPFRLFFWLRSPFFLVPFRADRWSEMKANASSWRYKALALRHFLTIIVPETAVTRTSRHCLRACPLSFAFLRFSCFLATKSRQNCRGRDENVEKREMPPSTYLMGNAENHKKYTFLLKKSTFSKTFN